MRTICVFLLTTSFCSAQWLPDNEQQHLKRILNKSGVTFPKESKFYNLQRISQRLVTVNSTECNGIYDTSYDGLRGDQTNINRLYPWKVPAGLEWASNTWAKASFAYFPGEINVWREYVRVQNGVSDGRGGFFTQPQPHVSWSFPKGTIFGEMLINGGRAFEIREREKLDDTTWSSGVTFRPFASIKKLPKGSQAFEMTIPPGKLTDFGIGVTKVEAWYLPKGAAVPTKLVPSKLVVTTEHEGNSIPANYLGVSMRCNTCHSRAGESTSYGATALPGADFSLSWHPFKLDTLNTDTDPILDKRWPIRITRQ